MNSLLYEKMKSILERYNNEEEKVGKPGSKLFLEIIGNDNKLEFFCTPEDYEKSEWDLFPQNIYEVSPFVFLYLLRLENYTMEEYMEIGESFYDDFPEIVDGYDDLNIELDVEELDDSDRSSGEGCKQIHKELKYKDGLTTYINSIVCRKEEYPTSAKQIIEKERMLSKFNEDSNEYKKAREALKMYHH